MTILPSERMTVMSDLHRNDSRAVVYAGMSTAIAVILSMIGLYMPFLYIVAFLLIPLPIVYLAIMQGIRWAVIVTIGVIILDAVFFGIVSAASVGAWCGVLGIVLGACYRYRISAVKTLLASGVVVLSAWAVEIMLTSFMMGIGYDKFFENIKTSMELYSQYLSQFYSGEMLEQAQANMKTFMENFIKGFPFAVGAAALMYSWIVMALSKEVFNRLGVKDIPSFPPIERWEMPKITVYIYLVGVAMHYAGTPAGMIAVYMGNFAPYLESVGYNLTAMGMFLFWLQGAAVVCWSPRRLPVMRSLKWIVIIFGIISPVLQFMLFYVGLFDLVLGYRQKRNYQ